MEGISGLENKRKPGNPMAKYLSWDLLFQKSYYATAKDELSKNQDAMKELEDIGKDL